MSQVNVTINGRQFRMACEDGEEARLPRLAAISTRASRSCATRFGEIGDTRLTVMAALTLADELRRRRRGCSGWSRSWRRCRSARVASADRSQGDAGGGRRRAQCGGRAHREHHQAPEPDGRRGRRPDGMTIAYDGWRYRGLRITLVARGCEVRQEPYSRGLIDPQGSCPWPGSWARSYGAHLLS